MKLVYETFYCPECGQIRNLRAGRICVDCKDKIVLDKISRSRKMQNISYEQICM